MFTLYKSKTYNYLQISIVIILKRTGWVYSKVRIRFLSPGHFFKSRFLKRPNMGPCHKIVSRRQKIYSNGTWTYSGFKYNHNCYSCVYKTFPNHRYTYFQFSWIYRLPEDFHFLQVRPVLRNTGNGGINI